ncbi:hypothetical protein ACLIA0_06295 [Bacillaceae bacterium W0354]
MSVEIRGVEEIIKALEQKLGKDNMQKISDKALLKAADEFVKALKIEFERFKDTGASIDEITVTGPVWDGGVRVIKVHWRGPKGRYRIIHLNEWGTIKNPNPRGKGAIARAMKNSEKAYREAVKKALESGL